MTKEEFSVLESLYLESGQPLKEFLQEIGVPYTTYHYWRKKTKAEESVMPIAPVSIIEEECGSSMSGDIREERRPVMGGVILAFPNGLRAHFGPGSEGMLKELLTQSLSDHVQPQ